MAAGDAKDTADGNDEAAVGRMGTHGWRGGTARHARVVEWRGRVRMGSHLGGWVDERGTHLGGGAEAGDGHARRLRLFIPHFGVNYGISVQILRHTGGRA